MKKSIVMLSLLSVISVTAIADTLEQDRTKLDASMKLMKTPIVEQSFIQVDFDASYEEVIYSGYIIDLYAENYVSRNDARDMGLEKIEKFHVYEQMDNLDELTDKIAKRIEQDKPAFFSVDLYRDYYGDSGAFRYVARVMEYK